MQIRKYPRVLMYICICKYTLTLDVLASIIPNYLKAKIERFENLMNSSDFKKCNFS